MGVSGVSFGISGREDSVDKDEGANNLSTKAISLSVAMGNYVCTSTISLVGALLEAFHHTSTTDGTQALHHHVEDGPSQGQLPGQEESKGHCRVDMPTWMYTTKLLLTRV